MRGRSPGLHVLPQGSRWPASSKPEPLLTRVSSLFSVLLSMVQHRDRVTRVLSLVILVFLVVQLVYTFRPCRPVSQPARGASAAAPVTVRTVCPRNCYCTCGMLVTRRGRPNHAHRGRSGQPRHRRSCLPERNQLRPPGRHRPPAHPLRRQRDGSFDQVTWDEALGEIAAGSSACARAGPERSSTTRLGQPRRARRAVDGLLAPVRRLHAHLRRPLLARRPRGDAADLRRQPPQPSAPHARQPLHPALGPQPGRDQRPPVAADPGRAGARRDRRGRRPAQHRHDRRRRRAPAAAPRHRRRTGARAWRASSSMPACTTPRSSARTRTGFDRVPRTRLRDYPLDRVADDHRPAAGGDPRLALDYARAQARRCSSPASACSGTIAPARRCGPSRCCRR